MPVIPDVMPWIQESSQKSSQNTLTFSDSNISLRATKVDMPLEVLVRYLNAFDPPASEASTASQNSQGGEDSQTSEFSQNPEKELEAPTNPHHLLTLLTRILYPYDTNIARNASYCMRPNRDGKTP